MHAPPRHTFPAPLLAEDDHNVHYQHHPCRHPAGELCRGCKGVPGAYKGGEHQPDHGHELQCGAERKEHDGGRDAAAVHACEAEELKKPACHAQEGPCPGDARRRGRGEDSKPPPNAPKRNAQPCSRWGAAAGASLHHSSLRTYCSTLHWALSHTVRGTSKAASLQVYSPATAYCIFVFIK